MYLHDVHKNVEKHRKRKRLGRGLGSGLGKTSGKGHKGHRSRSGYFARVAFQGSLPLFRHIPKRGFTNSFANKVFAINVESLEVFENGAEVNPITLREAGLARGRYDQLKILGDGELTKRLKVSAHRFSKSAKEKIEQAGGSTEVLEGRPRAK